MPIVLGNESCLSTGFAELDFLEDEAHPIIVFELFLYRTHLEIACDASNGPSWWARPPLEIPAALTAGLTEQADKESKEVEGSFGFNPSGLPDLGPDILRSICAIPLDRLEPPSVA